MNLDSSQLEGVEKAIDALQNIDSCDRRDFEFLQDALDELYKIRTEMLRG